MFQRTPDLSRNRGITIANKWQGESTMKRSPSTREAKRELLLRGGNDQQSTKTAFGANTRRTSAADRPSRAKTKASDRGRPRER